MLIVCPNCQATNRIPDNKSHVEATCGKCKQSLHTHSPAELDDRSFHKYIDKNDMPVLVDFWAGWCGPCQMMAPVFASVAAETQAVLFAKVDTEKAQQVSAQVGIRSLPTMAMYYGGKEVARTSGAMSEHQLKAWIVQTIQSLMSA